MANLQERLEELQNQQKQMEANFHQITGAIALVQQMIADEDGKESKSEVKKDEKKNPVLSEVIFINSDFPHTFTRFFLSVH